MHKLVIENNRKNQQRGHDITHSWNDTDVHNHGSGCTWVSDTGYIWYPKGISTYQNVCGCHYVDGGTTIWPHDDFGAEDIQKISYHNQQRKVNPVCID